MSSKLAGGIPQYNIIMAGLGVIWDSVKAGVLPRCRDGSMIQLLDVLYLLLKNKGVVGKNTGFNVCFQAERFRFSPLNNLFPSSSSEGYFAWDDFVDGLVGLFIASIFVIIAICVAKSVWHYLDPQFRSIIPAHKQWYVVANLCKAFILGCMVLSSRYWNYVYRSYALDQMEMLYVKRCAILYVSTDVVALLLVPKLPRSTIMHHVSTTILIVGSFALNLEIEGYRGFIGVGKMLILYGVFSTIPYLVNAYLALRVVYPEANWLGIIVKLSVWSYILCCACNWTTHLLWLFSLILNMELSVINVLYLAGISMLVNDDIVLIKWLMKRSSPVLEEKKD